MDYYKNFNTCNVNCFGLFIMPILTGSSINPFTPFPIDRTTMVALPYRAYPVATRLRPGCNASLTLAGPSLV